MRKIIAAVIAGILIGDPARAANQIDFDWNLIALGFGQYNADLLLCEQRSALDDRHRILEILKGLTGVDIQQADRRLTTIAARTYSEIKSRGCDRERLATFRRVLDSETANLRRDVERSAQ